MLRAKPRGFWSTAWTVFSDEVEVASLDYRVWTEGATLSVGDRTFRVSRSGWLGPFRLSEGEEVLLEARKVSVWRNRFEIDLQGAGLVLEPQGWTGRYWTLSDEEGNNLGRIGRESWWRRDTVIDLPAAVPLSVRAFLLCLVILMWRRQSHGSSS